MRGTSNRESVDDSDDDFFESGGHVNVNNSITGEENQTISAIERLSRSKNNNTLFNSQVESMDFEDIESVMWRKHQLRRFFQDRGQWWTSARRTTAWKWILVILIGVLVACVGAFVQLLTTILTSWRFGVAKKFINSGNWGGAFFSYQAISILFVIGTGLLCWGEPAASGSGIPEIKAFLNGVSLYKVVRVRVLFAKVIGMCLSVAAGLPLGKEGPMIHAGSVIGAAVSLGKTVSFGFDTSWTKFQDFRNDSSKRDFVTFGAAAGVAAAFRAPIGGVLFTLEEGASFWSTTITFRAFFCAMITMLTVSLIFAGPGLGRTESAGIFTFGQFDNLERNKTNYFIYEIFIFMIIGCTGGALGALFNFIHKTVFFYRSLYIHAVKWRRLVELILITGLMAFFSFLLPLAWKSCTPIPTPASDWTEQEIDLLEELVRFQCKEGEYNQLASLYFSPADTAMRQLYHFREYDHSSYETFSLGPLILFFIPYFLMAAITTGVMAPVGLFVPTLLAGAAYGRIWGHILNLLLPGYVADSGTYALIGAAAILGGMARMTISGTVIMLEAAGNMAYLLPLMVTFGASRYTGNAINMGMYEIQIELKKMPFLESTLHALGLLSYYPVAEIMTKPVITLKEVEKVGVVYSLLKGTSHHGFPVVSKIGRNRGIAMRKTLVTLLKLKAFSTPHPIANASLATPLPGSGNSSNNSNNSSHHHHQHHQHPLTDTKDKDKEKRMQVLTPAATVFYDTLERNYPRYPKIEEIVLTEQEMDLWLDIRPYMDTAPYTINQTASVQRCYRIFRTMGLRHLIVVNAEHLVTGIITRQDITKHRLEDHWFNEGHHLQKFINVEPLANAVIFDNVYDENLRADSSHYPPAEELTMTSGAGDLRDPLLATISSQLSYSNHSISAPVMNPLSVSASHHRRIPGNGEPIEAPLLPSNDSMNSSDRKHHSNQ